MKNSCSMRDFYFVDKIYSSGRAPKTEACLVAEAKEYCHRVLSDVQVDELVLHLQELQNDLVRENARLRRVEVRFLRNEFFFLRNEFFPFIRIGGSRLSLMFVKGSYKEAAASEIFNDGWWNCFESFAASIGDPDKICFDVMCEANVSSPEAFMRAEQIGIERVAQIVRTYADLKFVD